MKIALVGKAGSGKSTVSDYIKDKHDSKVIKFAEPMYQLAYEFFNMKGKDRALLQAIGAKFREINPDVWLNYLLKRARESKGNLIVDDCRKTNEFMALRKEGFTLIGIKCPDELRISRLTRRDGTAQIGTLKDVTETEMDSFINKCDYVINNEGSLDSLYEQVDSILKKL